VKYMDLLSWLPFGRVPEIEADALLDMLRNGNKPQLIDVRTRSEYRGGHIERAVSVPINTLRARLPALKLDPSRPVVAICATAHRSILAVRLLREAGFEARQLASGMIAWNRRKLPTVKESP